MGHPISRDWQIDKQALPSLASSFCQSPTFYAEKSALGGGGVHGVSATKSRTLPLLVVDQQVHE
jgi:hypothetical protein